ncbi:MAG: glycosyltransferase family 1 protein [Deltaproteobacteria bacterium]|jgi:glycosyltransferase involved in cell wall biosynthesis|nr:glycosyltransferase family 1 protein [Deltaproteobacteria bacterium]
MRAVVAIPPLPRMTGGIAVLYQLAESIRECGHDVVLAGAAEAPGLAARAARGFPLWPWEAVTGGQRDTALRPEDVFIAAEGWPNMLAPALAAGSRILVYAQNWAYMFSALPPGVSWHALPVSFLAVSQPVAHFVEDLAKLPLAGIVRPALEPALFRPAQPDVSRTVRVAWMPRKNRALAEQIRRIAAAMAGRDGDARLEWVEIRGLSREEVARTLGGCHIFLATGFPEGFALPPLEAMASGCLVVGFSGFGGWDYMRQAEGGRYAPPLSPRAVPWGGNGFFASDGDVLEAAALLVRAVELVRENGSRAAAIREEALRTAAAYSPEAQKEAVRALWEGLAAGRGAGAL